MFRQIILLQWTFVFILYAKLISGAHPVSNACAICICYENGIVNCEKRRLSSVPNNLPTNANHLILSWNYFTDFQRGSFANLYNLRTLNLYHNSITDIRSGWFATLRNLQTLNLSNNQIRKYEDGAFLFLPNLIQIDLRGNTDLMCGCHLPALVNYTRNVSNLTVYGECQPDLGKRIPIMNYSQCANYSLFQRNLKCQTCSGIKCNDSEVATCPGTEPVCRMTVSLSGITLKFERSCSSYRNCLGVMGNNRYTCNRWTNGTTCIGCCVGNLCNKNDFIGWTNSFKFYLIFKNFNNKNVSVENISMPIQHDLSALMGTFSVEYCGLEESKHIFNIYSHVIRNITKEDLLLRILFILNSTNSLRGIGIQQPNIELIDDIVCKENTSSDNGTFHWPVTKVGTNATIPCHANVATRYCSSRTEKHLEMTSLECSPFTGVWQEPDMSQCYNTEWITKRLKDIKKRSVDEASINITSKEFLNVSRKSEYFKQQDIVLAVNILWKMLPLISNRSANGILNKMLLAINNIISAPEKVLIEAEQANGSISRLLDIIETVPEKIPLEGQQVTFSYSNFGIGVAKVNKDTYDGLFYGVSYGNNGTEALLYNNSYLDPQEEDLQTNSFISLPKSLPKHLTDKELSTFSRILFFSLRNDKLYRVILKSRADANIEINSYVLAASVANISINNLDEPVNISFSLINQNVTNPTCVYWDETTEEKPHWSAKGCKMSVYVPGKGAVCSCDHLTSFALLMDVYRNEDNVKNVKVLSIISFTGCGISFLFLVLTIMIHVCFRNLWDIITSKILVSLCVPLAITNLIFVVGMQPYVEILAVCKTVAALLHYFLLTSLLWMSFEAIHVFVSMVVVFKTYQTSFMKRSSILAWGLPAIIVVTTLVINYTDNYVRIGHVCWLSEIYFYATFLAPVVVILILNLIIFLLIIWRLNSIQNKKKFGHKGRKVRVVGIVALFFLLGITWALAFFAVDKAAEVFKFLFAIFNTLQGLFIFIFYCICKKDTRNLIIKNVCRRKGTTFPAGRNKKSTNEQEIKTAEENFK